MREHDQKINTTKKHDSRENTTKNYARTRPENQKSCENTTRKHDSCENTTHARTRLMREHDQKLTRPKKLEHDQKLVKKETELSLGVAKKLDYVSGSNLRPSASKQTLHQTNRKA